jgi:hypothetical protein
MKLKTIFMAAAIAMVGSYAMAQDHKVQVKTRLDHLSGTQWVLVISYLSSEITSITCDKWAMLGVASWKHQNEFTIPAGTVIPSTSVVMPSVAILDANKFQGYCAAAGSIIAHTDDGDFPGVLDRGAGNWNDSTKLTFVAK